MKETNFKNILVQGKTVEKNKSIYVGTNDYLANGGIV
jgi:hypothetical protein